MYLRNDTPGNRTKHYTKVTFPILSAIYGIDVIDDFSRIEKIRNASIKNIKEFYQMKEKQAILRYKKQCEAMTEDNSILCLFGTNISQSDYKLSNRIRFNENRRITVLKEKKFYDIFKKIPKLFKKEEFGYELVSFIDEVIKMKFNTSTNYRAIAKQFNLYLNGNMKNQYSANLKAKNIGYLIKLAYHWYKITQYLIPKEEFIISTLKEIVSENDNAISLQDAVNVVEETNYYSYILNLIGNEIEDLEEKENFNDNKINMCISLRYYLFNKNEMVLPEHKSIAKSELKKTNEYNISIVHAKSLEETRKRVRSLYLGTENYSNFEYPNDEEITKLFENIMTVYIGTPGVLQIERDGVVWDHKFRRKKIRIALKRLFSLIYNLGYFKENVTGFVLDLEKLIFVPQTEKREQKNKYSYWVDGSKLIGKSYVVALIKVILSNELKNCIIDDERIRRIVLEVLKKPIPIIQLFAKDDKKIHDFCTRVLKEEQDDLDSGDIEINSMFSISAKCGRFKGDTPVLQHFLNHKSSRGKRNPFSGIDFYNERILDYSYYIKTKKIKLYSIIQKYFDGKYEELKEMGFGDVDEYEFFKQFISLEEFENSPFKDMEIDPDALHSILGKGSKSIAYFIETEGFEKTKCETAVGKEFKRSKVNLTEMKNSDLRCVLFLYKKLLLPFIHYQEKAAEAYFERLCNISHICNTTNKKKWKNARFHMPIDTFVFFIVGVELFGEKFSNCNYLLALVRDLSKFAIKSEDITIQECSCEEEEKWFASDAKMAQKVCNNEEHNLMTMIELKTYYKSVVKLLFLNAKNESNSKLKKLNKNWKNFNNVIPSCIVKKYKKDLDAFFEEFSCYVKYDPAIHSSFERLMYKEDENQNLIFNLTGEYDQNEDLNYKTSKQILAKEVLLEEQINAEENEATPENIQNENQISETIFYNPNDEEGEYVPPEERQRKKKKSKKIICGIHNCKKRASKICPHKVCKLHCRMNYGCEGCPAHWDPCHKSENEEKINLIERLKKIDVDNLNFLEEYTLPENPEKPRRNRNMSNEAKFPKLVQENIFSFQKRNKISKMSELRFEYQKCKRRKLNTSETTT